MLYQAMSVMRKWISQTFEKTSIYTSYSIRGNSSESEIQVSVPEIFQGRGLHYLLTYKILRFCISVIFCCLFIPLQIWENVISLNLKNGDFTKEWKTIMTMDLEGTLQKVCTAFFENTYIFRGKFKMLTCLRGFRYLHWLKLNSTAQRMKNIVILIQMLLLLLRSVL